VSFDEQPDGDPHGECAAEIARLSAERDALEARLTDMAAACHLSQVSLAERESRIAKLEAARELSALASATLRDESIAKNGRIAALERELAESREYRKHVQSHCEHDWTETLHGPDTVGEHCFICGVDREYDYGDEP
jgi:chromosome segregation ATPase